MQNKQLKEQLRQKEKQTEGLQMLNLNQQELKKLDFNKSEYEYFIENCNFTDRQKEILNLRRRGMSIVEISMYEGKFLPISTRTVDREIKVIKNKIYKFI